MKTKYLVQGALLIAVAVILQSVRLFIPFPPLVGTFIIGSLVNMMLVVTYRKSNFMAACILAFLLPLFAYFQGQLLLPVLIPVVIIGNVCYIYAVKHWYNSGVVYLMPAALKALCMVGGAKLLVELLNIGEPAASAVLFAMSIPQLVTGVAGVILGKRIILSLN